MKKLKIRVKLFPDGGMVLEVKKMFKKFSECEKLLKEQGFEHDLQVGNMWRFNNPFATGYIIQGSETHPYSERFLFSISIYPKEK